MCEAMLGVLQGFDPVGVFARDLAECLRAATEGSATGSIRRCRALLTPARSGGPARHARSLTALCGVDADDIADMIAEIRQLNPKPGLAFGSEPVQPVVPDVYVRVGPDGGWHDRAQFATRCRACWSIDRYYAEVYRDRARQGQTRTISPIA